MKPLAEAELILIQGGDGEMGIGIIYGVAVAAGLFGSGGLLGLAFLAGAAFMAWDEMDF